MNFESKRTRGNTVFRFPEFPVTLGVALIGLVIAITALHYFAPAEFRSTIVVFGASLAAAGALGGAFYMGRALQLSIDKEAAAEEARKEAANRQARIEDLALRQGREEAAFRYGERWNDASMFHSRTACKEVMDKRSEDPGKIRDFIKAAPQKEINIGNILNFLEEMALSVRIGRADEVIAKDLFCGIVTNLWHVTEIWIKEQRIHRNRPQLWKEVEWLYNRWK